MSQISGSAELWTGVNHYTPSALILGPTRMRISRLVGTEKLPGRYARAKTAGHLVHMWEGVAAPLPSRFAPQYGSLAGVAWSVRSDVGRKSCQHTSAVTNEPDVRRA